MKSFAVFLFVLFAVSAFGQHREVTAQRGIDFIPNKGQWENKVLYYAGIRNCNVFLENDGITYYFSHPANGGALHDYINSKKTFAPPVLKFHAYRMSLVGASTNPFTSGNDEQAHYYNYILGKDASKWKGNLHPFASVDYKEVYPGIGLHAASQDGRFLYDFIVTPNSNVEQIQLKFDGADYLRVKNNKLYIGTSVGEIVEDEPYAYQEINGEKKQIACRYKLEGNVVSFLFPHGYDKTKTLIIDPTVVFATFSGSTADNWGCTATYDGAGNFYSGGVAFSFGYPTTTGAFQTSYGGGFCDVSVTKYNPNGTALIYSTYIGGFDEDRPHSMMIDANGDLAITGHTASSDFPVTSGAYQTSIGGWFDMFVLKVNPSGTGLVGSTFLGGSNDDGMNDDFQLSYNYGDPLRGEVLVDNSGNVYAAGNTTSSNFPTVNATQSTLSGSRDGVVVKLNPNLTQLIWSTYLGGNGSDAAYNLVLKNDESSIFVSGGTTSGNFPVTAGTYQTTYGGGSADGFIAKFDNGNVYQLQRATYIGESQYDQCYGLQIDWDDNVYTTGQTLGGLFPVTAGVYSNASSSQFLMALDVNLTTPNFSTVYGSGDAFQSDICPTAFLVDTCGSIYISGWGGPLNGQSTTSTFGMPVTADAFKAITDGEDFYFIVFTQNASALLYATFMGQDGGGGEHVDGGTSRFNKAGEIYQGICGGCGGTTFPTTAGAWSTTNNSFNCNMVSLKIAFQLVGAFAQANVSNAGTGCVPYTADFQNTSSNANEYIWDFGDGSPVSNETDPSHTYNTPGTYTVTLIANNSTNVCASSDTTEITITASAATVDLGPDTAICDGDSYVLNPGSYSIYAWSNGSASPTQTVTTSGTYAVTVTNAVGCTAADNVIISLEPLPTVDLGEDTTFCNGQPWLIDAGNPGYAFIWSTGETTQSIIVNTTGQYEVTVLNGNCSADGDVTITYQQFQQLDLGPDTTVCDGLGKYLSANISNPPYLWSTGATTATILVQEPGTYWLHVGSATCASSDTITLSVVPSPHIELGNDTMLCADDTMVVSTADMPYEFLWSNGETDLSVTVRNPPQIVTLMATLGSCTVIDKKEIGLDPCRCIYVPNAFSPNDDGYNDGFQIIHCPVQNYVMRIYNRWGEKVFETNDPDATWNGLHRGKDAPVGVYVYYIQCVAEGMPIFREGNISLLR